MAKAMRGCGALTAWEEAELGPGRRRGDWLAYHAAIRGYIKAVLRAIERAKRAVETSEAPAARGEAQRDALRADRDRRASGSGARSRRRERGVREPAGAGAASGD